MHTFEEANNASIIAQFHTAGGQGIRPGRVILVAKDHAIGNYVVAWQGVNTSTRKWDQGWHHGEYCGDLPEALDAFHQRARKHMTMRPTEGLVHADSEYYCCYSCAGEKDGFEVLLSTGTKCQVCGSVANDGEWKDRTSIDAMKQAVGS
jgi:hypothetical protein